MRKLKIFEHISLDGVIQASGRRQRFPLRRLDRALSDPRWQRCSLRERMARSFDLLLGRRTYDLCRASGRRRRAVLWLTASTPRRNMS